MYNFKLKMNSILKDQAYNDTKKLIKNKYLNDYGNDEIKNKLLNLYNELTIDNIDYIAEEINKLIVTIDEINREIRISDAIAVSIWEFKLFLMFSFFGIITGIASYIINNYSHYINNKNPEYILIFISFLSLVFA